jgi:hypothetical protein
LTLAGAPLVLPEQEEVTLTTPAMSMSLNGVQSARAQELTDNQWDATAGLPADQAPEVPPDGELQGAVVMHVLSVMCAIQFCAHTT